MSFKLARTRHRGVYHADHRYIVPYSDGHDRDRYREFDTLSEARDFKTALRLTRKETADVDRVRRDYLNRQIPPTGLDAGYTKHAGQEGRNHY